MKKALCVILAAAMLLCSGCSGRAPASGENAGSVQDAGEQQPSDANNSPGGEADGEEEGQNDGSRPGSGESRKAESKKAAEAVSEITVWIGGDLKTLDPAKALYTTEKTMLLHAYETLLIYDEKHRLVPGQAEAYEVSPDGLTYTFHLRDGLTWSDGSKLTAADFVYSWKRLADYSTASPYAEDLLRLVDGYGKAAENGGDGLGVSAPDERTFVVTLSEPWVNFPQICAYPALAPLNKSYVENSGDSWSLSAEHFVGNGPMKLTERKGGWYIVFEKNEHYWNQEAVSMKSVTFWLNGKEEELESRYEAGKFQVMLCTPEALEENERKRQERLEQEMQGQSTQEAEAEETDKEPDMLGYQAPVSGTYYIMLNLQEEALQDARVRKALSITLDREYIAETVMDGEMLPAYSLIGPGISDAVEGESFWQAAKNSDLVPEEQQEEAESLKSIRSEEELEEAVSEENVMTALDQAKELLEAAGYPNGRGLPVIEFLTNDASHHLELGKYLQEAWQPLGIQVKIRKVSWQNFVPYRHDGDFMLARANWIMDMDDPLSLLEQFTSGHLRNDGAYFSRRLESAIRQAREAADRGTYYQALHQAEAILMEDSAVIPIAFYQDSWLQDNRLTGIQHAPDGTWRFSWGSLSE